MPCCFRQLPFFPQEFQWCIDNQLPFKCSNVGTNFNSRNPLASSVDEIHFLEGWSVFFAITTRQLRIVDTFSIDCIHLFYTCTAIHTMLLFIQLNQCHCLSSTISWPCQFIRCYRGNLTFFLESSCVNVNFEELSWDQDIWPSTVELFIAGLNIALFACHLVRLVSFSKATIAETGARL